MIRRPQWLFVCAFFAGGTALPCARAAPAESADCLPPLSVEVDSCNTISAAEVRRLLAIELGTQEGLLGERKPGCDLMRAQIRCEEHASLDPPGRVELRIDGHARAHALGREVDLSHQDPAVHPRLIAVALAELWFASSAEQQFPQKSVAKPPAPFAPSAMHSAETQRAPRKPSLPKQGTYIEGSGGMLVLFSDIRVLGGGGMRIGGDYGHHLGWDFELVAHHGAVATALGTITSDLLSARAMLLGYYLLPHLILRGGLGLRAGAAWLTGTPLAPAAVEGHSLLGPWGGPLGGLGISAAVARVRIDLLLEFGYVLWKVAAKVDGARASAIEGPWLSLSLGLGLGELHR